MVTVQKHFKLALKEIAATKGNIKFGEKKLTTCVS